MANTAGKVLQFPLRRENGHDVDVAEGFYTPKEAARIARVRQSTAANWNRKGIVIPNMLWVDQDDKETTGYSFSGVVYLRLLRMLRKESFPLREVVNAVAHLTDVFGSPGPNWENARIFSDGREIWVDHRNEWEVTSATRRGQKVAHILFGAEFALLRERADALLIPSDFTRYVEINPQVRNGLPVIRDTTIPTSLIHSLRGNGLTYARIREYYPHLSRQQIARGEGFERFLDIESLAS